MKKMIALILAACLLLSGCSMLGDRIKDPVTFYYIRGDYQTSMGQVIASEYREASGHRGDLSYLLALYSMGPAEDDFTSPLPKGTKIMVTEHTEAGIVLNLSENLDNISDAEFTLAGACLGLTCLELTDAQQITILCGDRSMNVTANNLLMLQTLQQQ